MARMLCSMRLSTSFRMEKATSTPGAFARAANEQGTSEMFLGVGRRYISLASRRPSSQVKISNHPKEAPRYESLRGADEISCVVNSTVHDMVLDAPKSERPFPIAVHLVELSHMLSLLQQKSHDLHSKQVKHRRAGFNIRRTMMLSSETATLHQTHQVDIGRGSQHRDRPKDSTTIIRLRLISQASLTCHARPQSTE